jgi:hypothetical protein
LLNRPVGIVVAIGTGENEDAKFHAEAPAGGIRRVYHGKNQSRPDLGMCRAACTTLVTDRPSRGPEVGAVAAAAFHPAYPALLAA